MNSSKIAKIFLVLGALLIPTSIWAKPRPKMVQLRPTQFALGFYEVKSKVRKLSELSSSELEEYLDAHPVPVVIGPKKIGYVLDHHHLVRALELIDEEAGVAVDVIEDWRHLSEDEFWQKMQKKDWVYLYDEKGNPITLDEDESPAEVLPRRVKDLKNDCYRSLAWLVRQHGGYRKTKVPFADFYWAQFFRQTVPFNGTSDAAIERALPPALKAARSPAAQGLPGYKRR